MGDKRAFVTVTTQNVNVVGLGNDAGEMVSSYRVQETFYFNSLNISKILGVS